MDGFKRRVMEYYGAGRVWRGTLEQDQSIKECQEAFERVVKAIKARNPEAPPNTLLDFATPEEHEELMRAADKWRKTLVEIEKAEEEAE